MASFRSLTVSWSVAFLLLAAARSASADTILAPVGGHPIGISEGRIVCKDTLPANTWTIEPDGKSVRPPTSDAAIGVPVAVRTAANDAACAGTATTPATLIAVAPRPIVDPAGTVVDADAGRVTITGKKLKGASLAYHAGSKNGEDTCITPDVTPNGESCSFAVPRDLPADPAAIALSIVPAGAKRDGVLFDMAGARVGSPETAIPVARVLLAKIAPTELAVDVSSGAGRVPLPHADAVASVDCKDATCDVEDGALVVRSEHGDDDKLDVTFHLRPRTMVRVAGATPDANPTVTLPLQRCPFSIVSTPIANLDVQRVVVKLGGACAKSPVDPELATGGGVGTVIRSELVGADRYYLVAVGRVGAEGLRLTARRGTTVLGVAQKPARRTKSSLARLMIDPIGQVDLVPTNRWARVVAPSGEIALVPVPVPAVYDVREHGGAFEVRAAEGATGAASLRLAYVDRALPPSFRNESLAEIEEPAVHPIGPANVPVTLFTENGPALVEVRCSDDGTLRTLPPSSTTSLRYDDRDGCSLLVHRERLREEDGTQVLQISVRVVGVDGTERQDKRSDRRVVVRSAKTPLTMPLFGVDNRFDRLVVRAGVALDDPRYVHDLGSSSKDTVAPEVQWAIVMGRDRIRLYATASVPTGLFRIADEGHSGILSLSLGGLLRLVPLSREGKEFPVGLEGGVMWLGIAGDTDPNAASRGAVAVVVGPGIGVPIANASTSTQTSINLHCWFEYEISRAVLGQSGRAWGIVFGPSISIGDVGASF